MAWAAITHLYDSLDIDVRTKDITHFIQALVKHGTSCPQGRTPIPPIDPILNLFRNWENNETLSIDRLRQKCISLLCLTAMCRPSDIAPGSGFFRKQIKFNLDNSATITFFGIKNDTKRKGFEIKLTPATEHTIDPVACLRCYLNRTKGDSDKECGETPVFRSLTSPSVGLKATTVSQILRKTLKDAGLADEYTARGFRAAGATAAIRSGCDPDSTRQIGRWGSRDVFFDHYVYPGAPSVTDKIFSQK